MFGKTQFLNGKDSCVTAEYAYSESLQITSCNASDVFLCILQSSTTAMCSFLSDFGLLQNWSYVTDIP